MKWTQHTLAVLVLALGTTTHAEDKPSSKDLKALFEKAETLELYSLDPGTDVKEPDATKGFHGWKILGKTAIKDAKTRKKILAAHVPGYRSQRWYGREVLHSARHGLRATVDGKTADVVICFQCLQIQFIVGEASKTETTTNTPQKVLDEVLTAAAVPLPGKK